MATPDYHDQIQESILFPWLDDEPIIDDVDYGEYDEQEVRDIQEEMFSEYGDQDAISCSCGDYNTFEENEIFNDHEDW